MDPRQAELANLLVNYSLNLQRGEKLLIEWFGHEPVAQVQALVKAAAARGVVTVWQHMEESLMREFLFAADEAQIQRFGEVHLAHMKQFDAYVAFRGSNNIFEMSDIPPQKRQWYNMYYSKPVHLDRRVKHTRWCVLRYPNAAFAQLAEMSLAAFEEFFYRTVIMDYSQMRVAMQPLKSLMLRTDAVRIVAPGTDLTFSIKDIPAIECDGQLNLPDGEVFTAPVRESVNGTIQYNAPSVYQGKMFTNVRLQFAKGKIVEATCDGDQDALTKIFDTDPGARYVGEFAVGFHPWIRKPIKDILFDEKIAGSIHFTPGQCYDQASNGNQSAVHWDLVLMQNKASGGGELYFDGKLIRKDGYFVIPELEGLNPEKFGAPPLA